MTAHINMRGQNKFATPPSVLCSILLFLIRIINQRVGRHNFFITCLCLSEAKGMVKNMQNSCTTKQIYISTSNLCVSCGEIIPEGRMICYNCEYQFDDQLILKNSEIKKIRQKNRICFNKFCY